MIGVAVIISGYGTLIIVVIRRSLQQGSEGRKRGFLRNTGLMILIVTGFVVVCIIVGLGEFPDVTVIQVCFLFSFFLSPVWSKFSIKFVVHD